jgi:protein pelota
MKLITANIKKGFAKIQTEVSDDLWYLSNIVEENDIVKARTLRKIKPTETSQAVKKPMTLELSVTSVDLCPEEVRITGKVIEGPEDVPRGSYHSFTIGINDEITITKEKWPAYQLDRLKESCETKQPTLIICVFDREEAYIAQSKRSGYKLLAHIQGDVTRKRKIEKNKEDFFEKIIKELEQYENRIKPEKIILASPAFWKEELIKRLKNPELKTKMVQATCSSADESSIDEVLKRDEVKQVLAADRVTKEIKLVDELLLTIAKQGHAVYGIKAVQEAAESGAVQTLLVTDEIIRKKRLEKKFEELDTIMKKVDDAKGTVVIISSIHAGGKKLDGLGGIAAITRFKL